MLNHIYPWRSLLRKSLNLSPITSLVFTKHSVSAAKLHDESADASIPNDAVRQILIGLRSFGASKFLWGHHFQTLASVLNTHQVDQILLSLRVDNSDSALFLFDLLRNEYGFRHSRVSWFIVSHVVARKGQSKELRRVLNQMVEEEGMLT